MDISRNLSHLLPYYFDFRNQIGSSFTEATAKNGNKRKIPTLFGLNYLKHEQSTSWFYEKKDTTLNFEKLNDQCTAVPNEYNGKMFHGRFVLPKFNNLTNRLTAFTTS